MARERTGSKRSELCYLCGEVIAKADRTNEHFVSRVFYPNRKLPNRPDLSLPAHRACNKSTELDEEHVAHALSVSPSLEGAPRDERWDRAIRALAHAKKDAFRTLFFRDSIDLTNGAGLLNLGDRLTWVLARICKALWFRREGTVLGADTQWSFRWSSLAQLVEAAGALRETFEVPDVAVVRWDAHVQSQKGLWFVSLRGHVFAILTGSPPAGHRRSAFTGARLTWPKPRPSLAEVQS